MLTYLPSLSPNHANSSSDTTGAVLLRDTASVAPSEQDDNTCPRKRRRQRRQEAAPRGRQLGGLAATDQPPRRDPTQLDGMAFGPSLPRTLLDRKKNKLTEPKHEPDIILLRNRILSIVRYHPSKPPSQPPAPYPHASPTPLPSPPHSSPWSPSNPATSSPSTA